MLILKCLLTVWLCEVRDFETLHSQAATEPIRLFIFSFLKPNRQRRIGVVDAKNCG